MSSLHEQAKELFLAALDRPPGDRSAFLDAACAHDPALKHEVESLLAFHVDEEVKETDSGEALPDSEEHLFAPGVMFAARYRMVRLVGRGGMGEVWQAPTSPTRPVRRYSMARSRSDSRLRWSNRRF